MALLRIAALDGFLRRRNPAVRSLLVYGSDAGEIAEVGRQVVASFTSRRGQRLEFVELDDRALAGDPGRLSDEVHAMSLLGDVRLVRVRDADVHFAKAVRPILEDRRDGNFILVEAANLGKGSPLRVLYEEHPLALVLPLYEATPEGARRMVSEVLSGHGMSIGSDALSVLIDVVGPSSSLLRSEAEKLALYCRGAGEVTITDVEALCGGGEGPEVDDLVRAAFDGDLQVLDGRFSNLLMAGEDASRLLSAAHQHALRLAELRRAIDRGSSIDQAVKSARPPIFFRLHQPLMTQLRFWETDAVLSAAAALSAAVRDCRGSASLSNDIASRALLAVARRARALRAHRV